MPEKKQKILMIEEDRFLRKIYKNKLTKAGFDFQEAVNGEEGLNKVISEIPDLVLLDPILSRKSGFDVLIEMKGTKETKSIPVIILSNLAQESDIKRAYDLGVNDYLVKPDVSLSEVVDRIKECLTKVSLQK